MNKKGVKRKVTARKVAKFRAVRPAVEKILCTGSPSIQAAVLRAVIDHPSLAAAREIAGIHSSKQQVATTFLCCQTARLLTENRKTGKKRGNTTADRRGAAEIVFAFTAPSPGKKGAPSKRQRALVMGLPRTTMQRAHKAGTEKRRQLTARERDVYWSRTQSRKGYRRIGADLRSLLIAAFHDHPHVIVSPNAKDTMKVKNADGEKVEVRKILTMVGLGTIFSDIVRDNPTISKKVGERTFRYIISTLGCVRRFKESYKTMCGCTLCVGLQSMHHSLQVKRGMMHRKIAFDMQRRTTRAQAKEMSRGWGDVSLDPKPSDAVRAGTCVRWSNGDVPHWECQTLSCGTCTPYPVPAEEAREDEGAEMISFHVYEYFTSLCADGKERRQMELVQKRTTIGQFHREFYVPMLNRSRYHMASYKLAAHCRSQRRDISRGSISSHRDYGERMGLSFNEEIQSSYYQNTSVSVEGASVEWVDEADVKHTRYFGHWSDDSKQDASATTHNM